MSNQTANADVFGSKESQDSYLEGLSKLRETDPEKYKALSPSLKQSIGYWESSKKQKEKSNNESK